MIQPAPPGHSKRVALTLLIAGALLYGAYRCLHRLMPGLSRPAGRAVVRSVDVGAAMPGAERSEAYGAGGIYFQAPWKGPAVARGRGPWQCFDFPQGRTVCLADGGHELQALREIFGKDVLEAVPGHLGVDQASFRLATHISDVGRRRRIGAAVSKATILPGTTALEVFTVGKLWGASHRMPGLCRAELYGSDGTRLHFVLVQGAASAAEEHAVLGSIGQN